ncbi:hypothetical protein Bca4012_088978 [Brassica carinata]
MISLDSSTKKLSGVKKTSFATPGETTPNKATPSQTTPGETTHSGLPSLAISPRPSVGPINSESSREDLVQSSERETAEPSVTDGNKKKRSGPDSSASIDAQARTGSDEPPKKKKKKKEKKKRRKSIERQSEPVGDSEGHEPVVHEGSPREAATRAVPRTSQGDHATERSNEPTGRELGESSVQEHEVVSRVERSEDENAPLVLDPAPSMANLVVSEESLIPILGVSDANPTPLSGVEEAGSGPFDLLELSDSSAEEEGGEKSDERIPGDNPQGTEEGVVHEVENPPASTTDEAGGASVQLEARVAEEDLDRVEN